jgi:hypothetical protein
MKRAEVEEQNERRAEKENRKRQAKAEEEPPMSGQVITQGNHGLAACHPWPSLWGAVLPRVYRVFIQPRFLRVLGFY